MKHSILRELSGVTWAALVSPLHAARSLLKPVEPTMTIVLSRRVMASRSAVFAALVRTDGDLSLPPGVVINVISAEHPVHYRLTMPGGEIHDTTITDRVEGYALTLETVITSARQGQSDFSRTIERFEIEDQNETLALNLVMVLVLSRSMDRLTRSYSELLMTHFQRMRLNHLISIAETLHGKPNQ